MTNETKNGKGTAHLASARMVNLAISTKFSVEIANLLRYKQSSKAKQILERVMAKQEAVPFKQSVNDLGHKAGMRSGRYPIKAAKEFLRLVNSVEKNAEDLGLNVDSLKITHILANKASIPMTGGRTKGATKRTHIEIKVSEFTPKAKAKKQYGNKFSGNRKGSAAKPASEEKIEAAPVTKEAEAQKVTGDSR